MRENFKEITEEIVKIVWHPSRIYKWPEDHLINDLEDCEELFYGMKVKENTIQTIKMSIKLRS
jgi:hypothetical protein